jgi:UDP-glucose 4-epimerase
MIGLAVVRRLAEMGHEVVVLDLRPEPADSAATGSAVADVTDREAVRKVLLEHEIETVVHTAALVATAQRDPVRAFEINVGGTLAVLEGARAADVERVVYCSSRAVYGDVLGADPRGSAPRISERQPVNPKGVYDVTKVAAEGLGRNYRRDHGVEFVALRYGSIYGPGKDVASHGGFGILSRMVEDPARGRPVRVERGGDQVDDMIYVEDVALGTALAVTATSVPETEYHVSSGVGHTLHDLAAAVEAAIPGAEIEIGPGLDHVGFGIDYYAVLENDRARRDLGFEPEFDLRTGVADYLARLAH